METSKLKWLSENQRGCFLCVLINPPKCHYRFRDRNGWNQYQIATFSHNHEMEAPSKQRILQTPCSSRCWQSSVGWVKCSKPDNILWPGDPGDRCTDKWEAQGPVGKFLLGSDPLFYFSPLVIMCLAFVLGFSVCKVLSHVLCLPNLKDSSWIRCFGISRGGSATQTSLMICSISNIRWLMGLGLEYRF